MKSETSSPRRTSSAHPSPVFLPQPPHLTQVGGKRVDIPPNRCLCICGSYFYELLSFLKFLYLWTMQHLKFSILQMRKCYQERGQNTSFKRHLSAAFSGHIWRKMGWKDISEGQSVWALCGKPTCPLVLRGRTYRHLPAVHHSHFQLLCGVVTLLWLVASSLDLAFTTFLTISSQHSLTGTGRSRV